MRALLTLALALLAGPALAQTKISAMPSAASVTGAELIPIVQSGTNKTATPSVLLTYVNANAALGATQITSGTLPSGRLTGAYTGVTGLGTLTSLTAGAVTVTGLTPSVNVCADASSNLTSSCTNEVAITNLAQIAANTVLGNGTGGTANVTALATTGSGSVVLAAAPTLTGNTTVGTLNKYTFSAPATGITITGTDNTTITLPSATATLGGLGIANAWTSSNTYSGSVRFNSSVQGSAGRALITTTAPTVSAQFTSTGSATVNNNSSSAIVVTLPGTGTANTGAGAGVLTFAAATTGYVCMASDRTTPAVSIVQTATTTTTATFQVTGSPTNADVYQFLCIGY